MNHTYCKIYIANQRTNRLKFSRFVLIIHHHHVASSPPSSSSVIIKASTSPPYHRHQSSLNYINYHDHSKVTYALNTSSPSSSSSSSSSPSSSLSSSAASLRVKERVSEEAKKQQTVYPVLEMVLSLESRKTFRY